MRFVSGPTGVRTNNAKGNNEAKVYCMRRQLSALYHFERKGCGGL